MGNFLSSRRQPLRPFRAGPVVVYPRDGIKTLVEAAATKQHSRLFIQRHISELAPHFQKDTLPSTLIVHLPDAMPHLEKLQLPAVEHLALSSLCPKDWVLAEDIILMLDLIWLGIRRSLYCSNAYIIEHATCFGLCIRCLDCDPLRKRSYLKALNKNVFVEEIDFACPLQHPRENSEVVAILTRNRAWKRANGVRTREDARRVLSKCVQAACVSYYSDCAPKEFAGLVVQFLI